MQDAFPEVLGGAAGEPTRSALFVVPASGTEAQRHFTDSIAHPITKIRAADYFPASFTDEVRQEGDSFYAWAATPGPRNRGFWNAMHSGDFILFYQSKAYSYVANVVKKVESPDFADALWGREDSGDTWSLVYFLTTPRRVDVPIERLSDYLQETPYLGFVRIPDSKTAKIIADFGSLQQFLDERLMTDEQTSTSYFLIRSNERSAWQDSESSYHYGSTVPNYRKLKAGSSILVDRRAGNTVVVAGRATIASVTERSSGDSREFDAVFDKYATIDPPIEMTPGLRARLQSMPGYNVQHSIRPISAEIYNAILSREAAIADPAYSALITPNDALARQIFWDAERTNRLIHLFNRSRQLLLTGPPGTGKTFIARALAQVATISDTHRPFVQFHPSYSYEDFIEGIRPSLNAEVSEGQYSQIQYVLHRGLLKQVVDEAIKQPSVRFVLVVDEINRANVPKVFGELLYCLEYRGRSHSIQLPYSSNQFFIPENLWLIATMNSADKSIGLLDSAFRRRFRHIALRPDYLALESYLDQYGQFQIKERAVRGLSLLNEQLVDLIGQDRLIGQSYLMRDDLAAVGLETIWEEDVAPVLEDHLYNMDADLEHFKRIFLASPP